MKKYLLLVPVLFAYYGAIAQWVGTEGPPDGVDLIYPNGTDMYTASRGSLFRSSGGEPWKRIVLGKKPVNVKCFVRSDGILYVGTDKDGILYTTDGTNWLPIQNNRLLQDTLHVSAITASGAKLLANVYHEGSHGSHSRIYEFEKLGKNLHQAAQFGSHMYVYSFLVYKNNKVLVASDKGIFLHDMSTNSSPFQLSDLPTKQIVKLGPYYYGVPLYYEPNTLFYWSEGEYEGSWFRNTVGLEGQITDLVVGNDGYYATTYDALYHAVDNVYDPWTRLDSGLPSNLYLYEIGHQGDDKYLATSRGIFKSIGNSPWEEFNSGINTSTVQSIYVNNGNIFAATYLGIYWSSLTHFHWEPLPHERFNRWANATHFAAINKTLFVATDEGVFRSTNDGKSWTEARTPDYPSSFGSFFSYSFSPKNFVSSGNNLFVVSYETPYISADQASTWREIPTGLPNSRIVKSLELVGTQPFLFVEEYPELHDIWHGSLRTTIYKHKAVSGTSGAWESIFTHSGNSSLDYSVVLGKKLIFLHYADGVRTLKSIDTGTAGATAKTLKLPETDAAFISNIFVIKETIVITTYLGESFVSSDEGTTWDKFTDQLPDGASSLSTMFEKDDILYAGLTDLGVYKRPYYELVVPKVSVPVAKDVKAREVDISATVSPGGNYAVTTVFEYSKSENFSPLEGSTKGTPSTVNKKDQPVTAKLKGLEGNTHYYVRLRGTNPGNVSGSNKSAFMTAEYLDVSTTTVVDIVDADMGTDMVTHEAAAKKPIELKLTNKIDSVGVALHTRGLTDEEWTVTPIASANETYQVILPHDEFDELGVEYYFTVIPSHAFRDPKRPTIRTKSSKVAVSYLEGLPFESELKFGTSSSSYNFISFPLHLSNEEITTILDDILGPNAGADKKKWRFLTYVGENGSEDKVWDEYPAIKAKSVTPGRGYWLAVAKPLSTTAPKLIETGAGKTVPGFTNADSSYYYKDDYFVVKLRPGYNQIGNPFTYKVRWTDVKTASGASVGDLIVYDNVNGVLVRNNQDPILQPFSGGYVNNTSTTETLLKIPTKKNPDVNSGRVAREEEFVTNAEVYLSFSVSSGNRMCKLGGLGVVYDASEGEDTYDLKAPPSLGDFPSIVFSQKTNSPLTRSLVPLQGEGTQWEFDAQTVSDDPQTLLSWATLKMPAGNELLLHDLVSETLMSMVTTQKYSFSGPRRFRVYYGTPEYVKENVRPGSTMLSFSPNPFSNSATINFALTQDQVNAHVKVSLIDIRGQEVGIYEGDHFDAGFHVVEWNGSNASLARGLYILKMEIDTQSSTKVFYQKVVRR